MAVIQKTEQDYKIVSDGTGLGGYLSLGITEIGARKYTRRTKTERAFT